MEDLINPRKLIGYITVRYPTATGSGRPKMGPQGQCSPIGAFLGKLFKTGEDYNIPGKAIPLLVSFICWFLRSKA